jgi:hypothetical protein
MALQMLLRNTRCRAKPELILLELSQPVRLYASFHGETTPFSIVSAG